MSSKRLSVIIPGYNTPDKWWRRCIDSVLSNIGPDDEIICVDDGSENKPKILDEYTQKDKRIRIIYRDGNGGLSKARNQAMEVAGGEFLTFVDSDDELMLDTYEKAIASLTKFDSDIAVFGVRSVWVNEKLYKDNVPDTGYYGCISAQAVKKLFDSCLLNYAWNKVYRTSFLKNKGISFDPDGMPYEDIMFVIECIMAGAKWTAIEYLGINYYKTHASLLSRYKESYSQGTRKSSSLWKKYKDYDASARDVLGDLGEVSEFGLILGEWDNIWRLNSPYNLRDKWNFLKIIRI